MVITAKIAFIFTSVSAVHIYGFYIFTVIQYSSTDYKESENYQNDIFDQSAILKYNIKNIFKYFQWFLVLRKYFNKIIQSM